MSSLDHYNFDETPLLDFILALSRQLRPDFPGPQLRQQLAELVTEARESIPQHLAEDLQMEKLLQLFYHHWGFGEIQGSYHFSDTLWLDRVLASRQGSSLSLGLIFLHIAHELYLPLMPVCFPTQLILRADWLDGEMWLINPLNGETLSEHILEVWIKGHIGEQEELLEEDLEEANNEELVRKFLLMLKNAYMQEEQFEKALPVSEMTLFFDPEDPYEIRDRGLIYAHLECEHIALPDLTYFINKCPDDPIAEVIRGQIAMIKSKVLTLH
ncbi:MAG: invasion regulator SirB1 [Enterobacteriaceae bacterium]